jgi:hypothetical protein
MRVLFFVEPVIVRSEPNHLSAHLPWAKCVMQATLGAGGAFALAANLDVCNDWRKQGLDSKNSRCFPLDPFAPLSGFGFRRTKYFKGLYGCGDTTNALTEALRAIRSTFVPHVAIKTSQNAFAAQAFSGLPTLNIEQAPLPRLGHPLRVSFDPSGHQTGSLIETQAAAIKNLPLATAHCSALIELLDAIKAQMLVADSRAQLACSAIEAIRAEGPVALLVTQSPDWTTYEGSFQAIEVEGLLCSWAERLPPGWIGVPTYHHGYQLDGAIEAALARSCPRLRFLPPELSRGLSEPLLTCADGMVTISSTTATTGLLLQKPTIVVGRSPYNAWCEQNPLRISAVTPLTTDEAVRLLAFLCNRYSHVQDDLMSHPETFIRIADATIRLPEPADWFLDFSEWSIDQARSLFNLGGQIISEEAAPCEKTRMGFGRTFHRALRWCARTADHVLGPANLRLG